MNRFQIGLSTARIIASIDEVHPGLSDDERVAMLGETAAKLLAIKPA